MATWDHKFGYQLGKRLFLRYIPPVSKQGEVCLGIGVEVPEFRQDARRNAVNDISQRTGVYADFRSDTGAVAQKDEVSVAQKLKGSGLGFQGIQLKSGQPVLRQGKVRPQGKWQLHISQILAVQGYITFCIQSVTAVPAVCPQLPEYGIVFLTGSLPVDFQSPRIEPAPDSVRVGEFQMPFEGQFLKGH